jgi:hypothetical protein
MRVERRLLLVLRVAREEHRRRAEVEPQRDGRRRETRTAVPLSAAAVCARLAFSFERYSDAA